MSPQVYCSPFRLQTDSGIRYHAGMTGSLPVAEVRQRTRAGRQGPCPFCGRVLPLTFHHLIPKKLHRRSRFRKHYTRDELNRGIDICRQCHDGIHERYDEMLLYKEYSEPGALARDSGSGKRGNSSGGRARLCGNR